MLPSAGPLPGRQPDTGTVTTTVPRDSPLVLSTRCSAPATATRIASLVVAPCPCAAARSVARSARTTVSRRRGPVRWFSEQGAARGGRSPPPAPIDVRSRSQAWALRAQPPQPAHPRLFGEPSRASRRPGEAYAGRVNWRVDQVGQDREPADPVGERMVQHDDQGFPALGRTGDQHCRPQRRVPPQRGHDHREGGVQQCLFVSWLAAGHRADVAADIKVGVVDPDRAATAERRLEQPLT
jgi:hypothetical protein